MVCFNIAVLKAGRCAIERKKIKKCPRYGSIKRVKTDLM